jgi:hypothetical protein
MPTAAEKASQNQDKFRAAQQMVEASRQNLKTAELNIARIRELNEQVYVRDAIWKLLSLTMCVPKLNSNVRKLL